MSYLLAILAAFVASGIFIALMGYDPFKAFQTILVTSFRTPNGFIQTLLKWVPLTLLALAFTVPYATMKFNIGGEGQLLMGAIGATIAGILLKGLPPILMVPAVLLAGTLAGAIWGFIPGWLLYRYKINEILTTVLLNFVTFALVNYIATEVYPNPEVGHPTTIRIATEGWLPMLVDNPPLHSGLILMVMVAIGVYAFTNRSTRGYELVATGANPRAAGVFGINVPVMFMMGLVIGGALAGLAGGIEVAGIQHHLIEGMHSNFKILGIIIGLIAKGSSLAVPFVAFFIAVMEVGASAMQRTLNIPIEMVYIVEALILLFVLLVDVVRRK
ncbi:MAG: ABC transporter permease [Anaerolineae bacterium]|nr:ABC transporter permease [Anaerolineae bacterium]